jgi:hypothetical protein
MLISKKNALRKMGKKKGALAPYNLELMDITLLQFPRRQGYRRTIGDGGWYKAW